MENGRVEKSTGKHVAFEKKLQNWTVFASLDKRSGTLRNFASKSNVFLRICQFSFFHMKQNEKEI